MSNKDPDNEYPIEDVPNINYKERCRRCKKYYNIYEYEFCTRPINHGCSPLEINDECKDCDRFQEGKGEARSSEHNPIKDAILKQITEMDFSNNEHLVKETIKKIVEKSFNSDFWRSWVS
jgi:hypothetical protein